MVLPHILYLAPLSLQQQSAFYSVYGLLTVMNENDRVNSSYRRESTLSTSKITVQKMRPVLLPSYDM
jgi:hypothetical protein